MRSVLPNCSPVMAGSLQTLIVYVAFVSVCNPAGCGFEQYFSDVPMLGAQNRMVLRSAISRASRGFKGSYSTPHSGVFKDVCFCIPPVLL